MARSDDLEQWVNVVTGASLASLRYGTYSLERRTIALDNVEAKYLRLTWSESQVPVAISGVIVDSVPEAALERRSWISVVGTRADERPGEYTFDLGGHMPVDRTHIELGEKNVVLRATLFSRADPEAEWRYRQSGLAYNLEIEGETLTQSDFDLAATTDRYWRIQLEQAQESLGAATPKLGLGWIPQRLVFVARGEGPYLLAYGSGRAQPTDFEVDSLLQMFAGTTGRGLDIKTARPGAQRLLGGAAQLQPAPAEWPWKQWILWTVLVVGVGLLAWMALRLFRQLSAST